MSDNPDYSSRFPEAGRRRVAQLTQVGGARTPPLIALYLIATALAAPLILFPGFYSNETVTKFGILFCSFILLLPAAGLIAAARLFARCKSVSEAAEQVDLRTQSLFDDNATLQLSRETLTGFYEVQTHTPDRLVDILKSDALRRAIVDRWEPANWLVDAHEDELAAGLPMIVILQRLALQFGILFTFVGLGVAFSSDAFSQSGGVGKIPDMQPLIEALRVKFMASIAGLISSIILLILAGACRRQIGLTLRRLDVMVDNILTLAKTMRSDPAFASDFAQIRESVQRMDTRIDGLADGYAKVVSTVRDGVADLATAREELKNGLTTLIGAQGKVVSEINRFYGRIVPEVFADEISETVRDSMVKFSTHLDQTVASMQALNTSVTSLADAERARVEQVGRTELQHREIIAALKALRSEPNHIFGRPGGRGGRNSLLGSRADAARDSVIRPFRDWFK